MQQFEYDKIPHIGEIHAVHGAYDLKRADTEGYLDADRAPV